MTSTWPASIAAKFGVELVLVVALSVILCGTDSVVGCGLSGRGSRLGGETGAFRLLMVGSFLFLSLHSFFSGEPSVFSSASRVRFMIVFN